MVKVIASRGGDAIGRRLGKSAGIDYVESHVKVFPDGELKVEITESFAGDDVFILSMMSGSVNESFMELLFMIRMAKEAGANKVRVITPYLGYSRQDHFSDKDGSCAMKYILDTLSAIGVTELIAVDLHSERCREFSDITIHNIDVGNFFASKFKAEEGLVVVSPDAGSVRRAANFAKMLHTGTVTMRKSRLKDGSCIVNDLVGDVAGKKCIIVDDIIDTGGTICKASEFLIENGASCVEIVVTHSILSGNCIEKIEKSKVSKIITSNTIEHSVLSSKFIVEDITPVLSSTISRILVN